MQAAKKIDSIGLSRDEKFVFTGNLIGQLSVLDLETFEVLHEVFAHPGAIYAVVCHPKMDYLATLGADLSLSLWSYNKYGELKEMNHFSLKEFSPDEPDKNYEQIYSQTHPLCFHSSELKLATRTGNAGLIEFSFDANGNYTVNYCVRMHRNMDLFTVAYVNDTNKLLTGSGDGEICLSEKGIIEYRWQVYDEPIHWFEPINENEYLVACDSRVIAKINVNQLNKFIIGEPFSRDDLEHVCFNPDLNLAYANGFDWNIYEIDITTCNVTRIIYRAPFKTRWLFYSKLYKCLIIQVRNGSLLKYDLAKNKVINSIKETPDAIWTSVINTKNEIILAGEGNYLIRLKETEVCKYSLKRKYSEEKIILPIDENSYTKRMVYVKNTDTYLLGRSSGELYLYNQSTSKLLHRFSLPIRDIAVDSTNNFCFVATEDSKVTKINFEGEILKVFSTKSNKPIWSLAYNETTNVVASFELYGDISLLDGNDLSLLKICENTSGRCKRAKWMDNNNIAFSFGSELHMYSFDTNSTRMLIEFVGNTIEDFIWDKGENYFITIDYTKTLRLYNYESLEKLYEVIDQMDYSKGILMLPNHDSKSYPLDFITYGRSGTANQFRVHNEALIALGPLFNI